MLVRNKQKHQFDLYLDEKSQEYIRVRAFQGQVYVTFPGQSEQSCGSQDAARALIERYVDAKSRSERVVKNLQDYYENN